MTWRAVNRAPRRSPHVRRVTVTPTNCCHPKLFFRILLWTRRNNRLCRDRENDACIVRCCDFTVTTGRGDLCAQTLHAHSVKQIINMKDGKPKEREGNITRAEISKQADSYSASLSDARRDLDFQFWGRSWGYKRCVKAICNRYLLGWCLKSIF